mmetsp:Transcript_24736/g.71419  ORF Transcript_24736/g.71419 Transcript_24736/m.71419 type:complete len:214 (+) Transcript_24736:1743-2384(+)
MRNDIIAAVSSAESLISSLRKYSLAKSTAPSIHASQSSISRAGTLIFTTTTSPAALHTGSCASTPLRARAMEDWELPTILIEAPPSWTPSGTGPSALLIPCSKASLILFPNSTELGLLHVPPASLASLQAAASYPTRSATRTVSSRSRPPARPAFWRHPPPSRSPSPSSLLRCRKSSLRVPKGAPQCEHSYSWTGDAVLALSSALAVVEARSC